jgi:hypothetical protein
MDQRDQELAAHFGPDGPVAAAGTWLALVLAGNLREAWPKTDPNLRVVLAQAWLWANREHPEVTPYERDDAAASLAGLTFDHDLWLPFEETQLGEIRGWAGDFNLKDWGAASHPRLVPPDRELVMFIRTGGEVLTFEEPTFVEGALTMLMRHAPSGWLVAGFSDEAPEPGWPPKAPDSWIV